MQPGKPKQQKKDERKWIDEALGRGILKSQEEANRKHLLSMDRKLLIAALRRLLMNGEGRSRSATVKFCRTLKWEDTRQLLPELMHNATYQALSGKMFSWDARIVSYQTLCKHGVRQALSEGTEFFLMQPHARWQKGGLKGLQMFGSSGKEYLPLLTKMRINTSKDTYKKRRENLIKEMEPYIQKTEKALKEGPPHKNVRDIKIKVPGYEKIHGFPK